MRKKIITSAAAAAVMLSALAIQTYAAGDGVIELPIISVIPSTSQADSDSSSSLDENSESHSHSYGSWIVSKKATCTQEGLQYRVCSECGECETSAIAKTEHRITLKTTAPTYTENGYTEHICSDCGYSYKDSFTPKKTLAIPEITGYSSAETGIRLNWKKVDGASGYRIYMYDAEKNKWGSAATVGESVTTYRKSGLAGGTLYKFKVKAFVKAGGKTIFGEACKIYTAASKPAKSKLLKPSVSNSAIRVKWKAQKCTGYQIYIYRNGQWKRAKTVFDSGITEFRISRLDKNTSYKIKVRAFTVDSDGKRVYGSFSDLTNVKTKK